MDNAAEQQQPAQAVPKLGIEEIPGVLGVTIHGLTARTVPVSIGSLILSACTLALRAHELQKGGC